MEYYVAPMEGLTDLIWRQAHSKIFGGAGRYYAPFITPPENRIPVKKKMAELAPENNPGYPLVPQLLSRDAGCTAWMIGVLRDMGYEEVNLNFGCPSGTVTAKGKGAGMLRTPDALDEFLYEVFAAAGGRISVKTRLGVSGPEEFDRILEIYNRYPICELTIHPRVMKQLYRGRADYAAFEQALPRCKMPVCYNGDITKPEQLHALEKTHPGLNVMTGRGIIADPALLRKARGGPPASRAELADFLEQLFCGYSAAFGSEKAAISRMKAIWFYQILLFDDADRLEKQLKKLREPWEYRQTVAQIFALPLRTQPRTRPIE